MLLFSFNFCWNSIRLISVWKLSSKKSHKINCGELLKSSVNCFYDKSELRQSWAVELSAETVFDLKVFFCHFPVSSSVVRMMKKFLSLFKGWQIIWLINILKLGDQSNWVTRESNWEGDQGIEINPRNS